MPSVLSSNAVLTPAAQLQRQVAAQVQRGLSQSLAAPGGSVMIRLSPEHLGHVRISVTMREGRVGASFEVGSGRAREIVEKSLGQLRSGLADKGFDVGALTVALAPSLPQRELGRPEPATDMSGRHSMPAAMGGAADASVGAGVSADAWGGHAGAGSGGESDVSGGSAWAGPGANDAAAGAESLAPGTEPRFNYVTLPDGRIGVLALA